jgi:hypothetical protein
MRGVGSVILSDLVIDNTLSAIIKEGGSDLSLTDFLENSFLDREEFRWTLRFRYPYPKIADMAVNAWAKSADAVIQEGLKHSLTSLALLEEMENLKACLFDFTNRNIPANCGNNNFNSVVNSINEISARIQAEKAASLGLFHALSVPLVNGGSLTPTAVFGQRNLFILSGALIGLFLSIIISIVAEIKRSRSI